MEKHLSSNILMGGAFVKRLLPAVIVALVVGTASCNNDPNTTKMQYVPDMADSSTVKPQREYLAPPEGSVSMNAILYPETMEESEKVLKNPFPANEQTEELGKVLFNSFCIPCHGEDGQGKGSITDVFPMPPDITSEAYVQRGDGMFFHKITFGGPIMPSLGHAISAHERWQIVHYVRKMQRQNSGK